MTINRYLTIIFLWLTGFLPTVAQRTDVATRLTTIDSLITNFGAIEAQHMSTIDKMKSALTSMHSAEERFQQMRRIVTAYRQCNTDSALRYSDHLVVMAKATGNSDDELLAQLDQSAVLAGAGQLSEARQLLEKFRSSEMSDAMKIEYYGQCYYVFALYAEYNDQGGVNRNLYYEKEFAYADSALALMKVDNPYYPLYKGWQHMRQGHYDEGIKMGENYLAYRPEDSMMKSQILYMMSVCCRMAKQQDRQLDYLLQAAITDLRIANCNGDEMSELASLLCNKGFISEAYQIINFDIQQASKLRNRVRMVMMQSALTNIQHAYNDKITSQNRSMLYLLIGIGLLLVGLAFTLLYILRQQRRLAASRQQLKHSNEQLGVSNDQLNQANEQLATKVQELSATHAALKEANEKLEVMNEQLNQANVDLGEKNSIKEEYIGFVLALCSDYISKLDRYRKDINRKVKTHLYSELNDMTESSVMMQSELKAFYEHFDSVFLHVYPGFVDNFNQLLQPEHQLHPKEGRLNTELRIFALMRLGISDSQKIADFLHCSLQTVYNNRLRTRQKAKNRETFDEEVRQLG